MTVGTIRAGLALPVLIGLFGCGEGGAPAPPKGGSPEWHWENAGYYYERQEFGKMAEELAIVAERDTPLNQAARVRLTALLFGLSRGYRELGDYCRDAIEADADLRPEYDSLIQQTNREARQFAIELTESLGEVETVLSDGKLVCGFPFPESSANEPAALVALGEGQKVTPEQLATGSETAVYRGIVLATSELCGFGAAAEDAEKAKSQFEAGAVEVPADDARLTVAKMLLDLSLVFSRERVDDPNIRRIVIDRSEQWAKPYLESEDDELKKRAEAFQNEIEDERRDMSRKSRRLKKRE